MDTSDFVKSYSDTVYTFLPSDVMDSLLKINIDFKYPWVLDSMFIKFSSDNMKNKIAFKTSNKYKKKANKTLRKYTKYNKYDGYFSFSLFDLKMKVINGGVREFAIPNLKSTSLYTIKKCYVLYVLDIEKISVVKE